MEQSPPRNTVMIARILSGIIMTGAIASAQPYPASLATLAAASAADYTVSLQAERELNPLLRGADGRLAPGKALAIKSGALIGTAILQRWVIRKHPKAKRVCTWVNFGAAGVFAGVAWRGR